MSIKELGLIEGSEIIKPRVAAYVRFQAHSKKIKFTFQ